MPKSTAPSAELQDALSAAVATIMKATNQAVNSVEESNKEELKCALQDVRDAQRERDEYSRERDALVKEKADLAVELEVARSETERWRAAAEKAEWMINHHAETITQLRLEVQQWKDQFMRVDEERLGLTARNDELVSQQLYASRREVYYQQEPLTPRSQGPQAQTSSGGRATSRNQYHTSSGYLTDGDVLGRRSQRDQNTTRPQKSRPIRGEHAVGSRAKPQPIASSSRHVSQAESASAQPKVLRTVHVVMERAPVKEESLDSVALGSAGSGSQSLGDEEQVGGDIEPPIPGRVRPQRRDSGKQKAPVNIQGSRRRWSEGRRVYDEVESESGSPTESEDEYIPPSRKAPSRSRARPHEEDEDEDELMLGGFADDRHETYAAQKTSASARRAQTQPVKQGNAPSASARKRNSPYPAGPGKKPRNR